MPRPTLYCDSKRRVCYKITGQALQRMTTLTRATVRDNHERSAPLCRRFGLVNLGPVAKSEDYLVPVGECKSGQMIGGFHTHPQEGNVPSSSLPSAVDMLTAQHRWIDRDDKGVMAIGSKTDGVVFYAPHRPMTDDERGELNIMTLDAPGEYSPRREWTAYKPRLEAMRDRLFWRLRPING